MKVLQINSVCGIKSTGRICTDLADILVQNGHDCRIAYGRETVPEKYQHYALRIGTQRDVMYHALSARFFDNAGFGSRCATQKLICDIRAYDPDVIHLHNIHGYYINIQILFNYLKSCGKKIIWTLHDCWSFTGHCAHFDYAGCDKWKTGCNRCPQKREYPKSDGLDASCRNYRRKKELFTGVPNVTLVTPSHWLADLTRQSYLREYPVVVIPNGIDTEVFRPTESNFRADHHLENQKIILGVASVWTDRKGLQDFVKLSKMLDDTYKIVLVGLSKEQIQNLPGNILGIERTNSTKELAELYTAADVCVNPTYEDNYPTVNLEAQACGTPVITYMTGGSSESVPKNNQVPKGEFYAVAKCIRDDAFHALAEISFDKTNNFNRYMSLYANETY